MNESPRAAMSSAIPNSDATRSRNASGPTSSNLACTPGSCGSAVPLGQALSSASATLRALRAASAASNRARRGAGVSSGTITRCGAQPATHAAAASAAAASSRARGVSGIMSE